MEGIWFPDDVGEKWRHALMHVHSIEWAIEHCTKRRTALQAGGNVGLWPRRLAEVFSRVLTFEPDLRSRECLLRNVPGNVTVFALALGAAPGACGVAHKSLGGHRVIEGDSIAVTTVDALELEDLDLLQLDVEGYEWHALQGAAATIARCRPLIQIELRDYGLRYGHGNADIRTFLSGLRYREVSRQQGSDVVFQVAA